MADTTENQTVENNTAASAEGQTATTTDNQSQQQTSDETGKLTLTQSELDKLIDKAISTRTTNLQSDFEKQMQEAQKRIKGLEAQTMTAEELAAQQLQEKEQQATQRIAELTETNQRLQIKAKIAETGLPLDESLFVNTSLDIEDVFSNIDNMAKRYQEDLNKAIAEKQSKAGASLQAKSGQQQKAAASNTEYMKTASWG